MRAADQASPDAAAATAAAAAVCCSTTIHIYVHIYYIIVKKFAPCLRIVSFPRKLIVCFENTICSFENMIYIIFYFHSHIYIYT